MSEILKKASFDYIRYAQVWEDSQILLDALDIKEDGSYLSIASAGDNVLSILSKNPKEVVALDLSMVQLYLLELKVQAFKTLEYREVLEFLGVKKSEKRVDYFYRLSLKEETKNYFEQNISLIRKGVNHCGKFENYFKMFREKILPLVHSKKTIDKLLEKKTLTQQSMFYDKTWNNFRWRIMFKIFFSKTFMGYKGRDKAFFNYVEDDVSTNILKRTKHALTQLHTYKNPYLHYILKGCFKDELPTYLKEENFHIIKNNLSKLTYKHESIEEYLENNTKKFDGFNLSDIFEYISEQEYEKILKKIIKSSNNSATLVYWNMMVKRSHPTSLSYFFDSQTKKAQKLNKDDRTFFYRDFIIEKVKNV